MSRGINKVILVGNLGKDPEVQYLESNVPVAKFTLATGDSYKDKSGNRVDTTEWHNVVLWRGLAEIAEKYLRKGSRVYVEGKLTHRSYEDKDGNKKYFTEVVGRELLMLDGREEGAPSGNRQSSMPQPAMAGQSINTQQTASADSADYENDLPF
jgi:single-strand DNA-binding protein